MSDTKILLFLKRSQIEAFIWEDLNKRGEYKGSCIHNCGELGSAVTWWESGQWTTRWVDAENVATVEIEEDVTP